MIAQLARALTIGGLLLFLAACGGVAPTATPPATNTPVPPTNTAVLPTSTAAPPTSTVPPPTATSVPPTNTVPPPTATTAPPTATVTRAAAATPTTATRPAASATPAAAGGGGVMLDGAGACQITLPATFAPDAADSGNASSSDGNAFLNLASTPTAPLGLAETVAQNLDLFSAIITDYKEIERQSGTVEGRPYIGVTFTATVEGTPVVGQFYFVEDGATICALSAVVMDSAASQYGDTFASLVDSIRAVKP